MWSPMLMHPETYICRLAEKTLDALTPFPIRI